VQAQGSREMHPGAENKALVKIQIFTGDIFSSGEESAPPVTLVTMSQPISL
jgi:hypothetical protein